MSLFTVIFIFQFLVLPVNLLRGPCGVLIIVAVVSLIFNLTPYPPQFPLVMMIVVNLNYCAIEEKVS